jgi:hypothetical protein
VRVGESIGEKLDVIDGQSLELIDWQSSRRLNLSDMQYSSFISSLSLVFRGFGKENSAISMVDELVEFVVVEVCLEESQSIRSLLGITPAFNLIQMDEQIVGPDILLQGMT